MTDIEKVAQEIREIAIDLRIETVKSQMADYFTYHSLTIEFSDSSTIVLYHMSFEPLRAFWKLIEDRYEDIHTAYLYKHQLQSTQILMDEED